MRAIFITPEKSTLGFEPIMWLRAQEMIQTLRSMGIEILPVSVDRFSELFHRNSTEAGNFKSHFIVAPNFNYFLLAAGEGITNLSSLPSPVLALWDDPLGALASFVNGKQGRLRTILSKVTRADRFESLNNFIKCFLDRFDSETATFRRVMQHPLLRHFAWDSGHIEAVDSLGLLEAKKVQWCPLPTYAPFLRVGERRTDVAKVRDVGFCGNVYLGLLRKNDFFQKEPFRNLTIAICNNKLQSLNRAVWSLLVEEIQKLPAQLRNSSGLRYQEKCFWDYYIFVVWHAANTLVRMGILNNVDRGVSVYGLFADAESIDVLKAHPNLKYEGIAHHFNDLPGVYASTKINICISNGLVYKGMPSKLIDCLASGGFALCDPKEDLKRFFGPVVEKIFFRNVDELNSKIDYYLAHPVERDDIVTELGLKIRQHCTLKALFRQVIDGVEPQ